MLNFEIKQSDPMPIQHIEGRRKILQSGGKENDIFFFLVFRLVSGFVFEN